MFFYIFSTYWKMHSHNFLFTLMKKTQKENGSYCRINVQQSVSIARHLLLKKFVNLLSFNMSEVWEV